MAKPPFRITPLGRPNEPKPLVEPLGPVIDRSEALPNPPDQPAYRPPFRIRSLGRPGEVHGPLVEPVSPLTDPAEAPHVPGVLPLVEVGEHQAGPDGSSKENAGRPFRVRAEGPRDLADDLSNLGTITQHDLLREFKSPKALHVYAELRRRMLAAAGRGWGVREEDILPHLLQEGLTCATMALLNGARAVGGASIVGDLSRQVPELQERARAKYPEHSMDAGMDMSAMYYVLSEAGLPLKNEGHLRNPLALTLALFQEGRFMGFSRQNRHAVAIVPLAGATPDRFALVLDSLFEAPGILSVDKMIELPLTTNALDLVAVYSVKADKFPASPASGIPEGHQAGGRGGIWTSPTSFPILRRRLHRSEAPIGRARINTPFLKPAFATAPMVFSPIR